MFRKSIAIRLSIAVCLAITLILSVSGWIVTRNIGEQVLRMSDSEMDNLLASSSVTINAYNDQLETTAAHLSGVFGEAFPGEFILDSSRTQEVMGQTVPVLTNDGSDIAGDYSTVDRFAEITGGNATIFVKRGDDFVRVITSVKKEDGSRAVGTLLSHNSPAYVQNIKGQPFTGKVTLFGRQFVTNYTPIKDKMGQIIGIRYIGISFSQSLERLMTGLSNLAIGDNGFMFIVDAKEGPDQGKFLLHPTAGGVNLIENQEGQFIRDMLQQKSGELINLWKGARQQSAVPWETHYIQIPELNWVLGVTQPEEDSHYAATWLGQQMLLKTVVTIIVVTLVLWLAVRVMVGKPLANAVSALETIAEGDYSQHIEVRGQDETGKLLDALKRMQQQVRTILRDLATTAQELGSAARAMSDASNEVAKGSAEQSEAATQIASTVEELTVSVDSLAKNAQEARELSESSFQISEHGASIIEQASSGMLTISDTVRSASENISELGQLSDRISGILEVIAGIAEQTNLLALNAAIEAARAGEQGRGFAVVADEVRGLAGRTTESASEITTTIGDIQQGTRAVVAVMTKGVEQVNEGADLATKAGESIEEIRSSSHRVMEMFMEISMMLNEQSQASTNVAENVERIATMTETNSHAVQEVATAAEQLETMASSLNQALGRFRV
ncbi:chemotaxis protein [Hahella sp. CCB-MM4]|uniref:methyl-accepting chemotaxis protein n=1 Tax=Hahella sp. (strain CCB-MM4) TaxID=1926491 RepID=UPI000B9AF2BF|nr:methyl-accepting chemotaxis protein [Hahella sp. CCB-MM4]OZG75534.1 chemotaxis protein [Hahella sp. CCB-MM4]